MTTHQARAERAKTAWQFAIYALLGLYFTSIFFFALKPLLGWPIPRLLGPVSTLLVWAFARGQAVWTLGWRRACGFVRRPL